MRHPTVLLPLRTLFSTLNSDSQRSCWLYILTPCCYTILKAICKAFLIGDPYTRDLTAWRAILLIRHATCALPLFVSTLNQLQKKSHDIPKLHFSLPDKQTSIVVDLTTLASRRYCTPATTINFWETVEPTHTKSLHSQTPRLRRTEPQSPILYPFFNCREVVNSNHTKLYDGKPMVKTDGASSSNTLLLI